MILLEDLDAEQRKKGDPDTPTRIRIELSEQAVPPRLPTSPRLPDYATSQAHAEALAERYAAKENVKQSRRRLWRAVFYAFLLYIAVSVVIAIPLTIVLRRRAERRSSRPETYYENGAPLPPVAMYPVDIADLPLALGRALACNNWTFIATENPSDSYYSLRYSIPANETISISSNFTNLEDIQSPITGGLVVQMSGNETEKNATVSVNVTDIGRETMRLVNVCLMRTNDGWGLAIYVPNNTRENDYHFDINLKLPLPSKPPHLTALATYLPSFNQTFTQLDSYTSLESFSIQGSIGSIDVESVHAEAIIVQTSAAQITGKFNASEKLVLETVLQPINANVTLYNRGGKDCPPTLLEVETGNSNLIVNVTLDGPSSDSSDDGSPSVFLTNLKTFGGTLEASYHHALNVPPTSLFVMAQNNLDPAQVYVDSKFEGTYDVHTTLADAIVEKELLPDPTGADRKRVFMDDHVSPTRALGWVGYGMRPVADSKHRHQQGHIEVASSLGDAILQLTDAPDVSHLDSKFSKGLIPKR